MKKVVMYWHNGRSLGHTAEVAKISKKIEEVYKDWPMVGLTGAYKGLDLLSKKMDVVKLPSFSNFDNIDGWNHKSLQGLSMEKLFSIREKISFDFLDMYSPDLFFVNHVHHGLNSELDSYIDQNNECKKILTLRGILFDYEKTQREYFCQTEATYINKNFDSIFIHIDPNVFSLEEYYDVPKELSQKFKYTGYLSEHKNLNKLSIRNELELNPDEKIIVCSMGGGQGAKEIWNKIIESLLVNKKYFDKAIIITGPYFEEKHYNIIKSLEKDKKWLQIIKYVPNMEKWMKSSDLFIGAAGSNMIGEILANDINAIVIPRQVRECEQLIHSNILENMGYVRKCTMEELSNNKLEELLKCALLNPIVKKNQLLMNGVNQYPIYIDEII